VVSAVVCVLVVEFDNSVICYVLGIFRLINFARCVLSSLDISSGGTKFEIFREHVGYLHFVLTRRARLFDSPDASTVLLLIMVAIFTMY